jgi:hypothetical protein
VAVCLGQHGSPRIEIPLQPTGASWHEHVPELIVVVEWHGLDRNAPQSARDRAQRCQGRYRERSVIHDCQREAVKREGPP